jgi:membrane protease YdiL (CAAX protease family)
MPASYQNLKKSRNSGRFWNSPPTGLLHRDGLPAIVSLDEHSRVSHLARERNAASRADAGILAMWISDGRKGVSHLLRQATRVKVSAFWWLFALLTPQIWFTAAAVLYLLLQGSPIVLKPTALLALGTPALLVTFLFGPLGEEFGWRGFLLPRLIQRFSVLAACFLVGIVWAVWHWPLFWKNIFKSPGHELFFLFANVTGLCFLICAVYLGSRSLLLAMMTPFGQKTHAA